MGLIPIFMLAPVVAPLALIVVITGVVAVTKGTATWLRLRSRKAAIIVTAAAAGVLLVSGSVSATELSAMRPAAQGEAAQLLDSSAPTKSAIPTASPTPTPVESTREEVVTEAIPFTETRVDDNALPAGQTRLRTAGQNGEKSRTYLVHMVDGQEVSREVVSEAVTKEPVTQVVADGTYVAPPPPPPSNNNCNPNYADACVPIASDVDCAGGSGNGPAYFDGVARVVGRDIYGLDRDGDGLACEH